MLLAIIALIIGVFLGALGFAVAYCKGSFETSISKYDQTILMYSDDWKELQEANKEQDTVGKEYDTSIDTHLCTLEKLEELKKKLNDLKNKLSEQNADADTENNMESVINEINHQKHICKISWKKVKNIGERKASSNIRRSKASIAWGKHFI